MNRVIQMNSELEPRFLLCALAPLRETHQHWSLGLGMRHRSLKRPGGGPDRQTGSNAQARQEPEELDLR